MCVSINALLSGDVVSPVSVNLKPFLSIVKEAAARASTTPAREALFNSIDVTGQKRARPKLLGLQSADAIKWVIYLDREILLDDQFHATEELTRALLHLELVRSFFFLETNFPN